MHVSLHVSRNSSSLAGSLRVRAPGVQHWETVTVERWLVTRSQELSCPRPARWTRNNTVETSQSVLMLTVEHAARHVTSKSPFVGAAF